jgi:hypothetical protein
MSINPVPRMTPSAGPEVPQTHGPGQSQSESAPKRESPSLPRTFASNELPQDEVKVQRDSQTNGEIVIRYIDRSGQVILQVPSEQLLNLSRLIGQDLDREQKARAEANAPPPAKGESPNGH